MPVSGLIIRFEPARRADLLEALSSLDAVELQPVTLPDTLVAVLESRDRQQEREVTERITVLPGVRSVSLACHNFEDRA